MSHKNIITGILIDVKQQLVREISFSNTLSDYYRLLGCQCITAPSYDSDHDIIVDDEGLLKDNPIFFEIGEATYAGNGLLVGVNNNTGDWISHHLNVPEIVKQVHFVMYVNIAGQIFKIPVSKQ